MKVVLCLLPALAFCGFGCQTQSPVSHVNLTQPADAAQAQPTKPFEPEAYTLASLDHMAERVQMKFGPTKLEGKLAQEGAAGKLIVTVTRGASVLAKEIYVKGKQSIAFEESDGQKFEPPIPIYDFPPKANTTDSWHGNVTVQGHVFQAEATITRRMETGFVAMIELRTNTGAPTPVKRTLKFWLDPKLGIYRRDFQLDSAREPLAEPPAELSEGKNIPAAGI